MRVGRVGKMAGKNIRVEKPKEKVHAEEGWHFGVKPV